MPDLPATASTTVRVRRLLLFALHVLVGLAVLSGCERKELDPLCTPVAPGQLVITEIRGPQTGSDTYGQWIEIYNTGAEEVNVAGLVLRIIQLDGTNPRNITIRDAMLSIAAGGYLVIGRFPADALPAHVDYGYGDELEFDLYPDGILELYVCNDLVDSVIYHGLPEVGSLALDGDLVPSAEANDVESNWCPDATEVGVDPTQIGIPGTPGAENRPCP
jgi:hypothetical protein